jgi:hypothetical protein
MYLVAVVAGSPTPPAPPDAFAASASAVDVGVVGEQPSRSVVLPFPDKTDKPQRRNYG